MLLTNALIEQVRCDGPGGVKYSDEKGMYLYVTATSKSWRMDYRFAGKRATITLGTWPRVTLQLARALRDAAKEKLARGIDPMAERHRERAYATQLSESSFEKVAERWLVKTAEERSPRTQAKVVQLLRRDVFPLVGPERIGQLTPVDMLRVFERIEARGATHMAHRARGLCSQIFRYAVASSLAQMDVTRDLKGALKTNKEKH